MSDLQRRSEQLFRSKGYLTSSVERNKSFPAKGKPPCRSCGHMPMVTISVDLWNVFDLIAIRFSGDDWQSKAGCSKVIPDVTFVQVTSAANHATRRNKILASAEAKLCVLAACQILIQSWKKVNNRWQPHDEWITLDQFVEGLPSTAEEFYEAQRKSKLDDLPPGSTLPLSPMLSDSETPF